MPVSLVLGLLAGARCRRRWAYQWAALGIGYLLRRHGLPPGNDPVALLQLLRPAAVTFGAEVDGAVVGVIEDEYGLTAVLEVGDTIGMLTEAQPPMPAPTSLLPPGGPGQPTVGLQLIVSGVAVPAAGATTAATSYRQLTEGRILGQRLAVRAEAACEVLDLILQETVVRSGILTGRRLEDLSPAQREIVEQFAQSLTNKFLHAPSQTLNQAAAAERAEMLALYQRIFDIPDSQ